MAAIIASSITVKELRQKARDLNIKNWYSLKKEDLLMAVADFKIKVPEVDVPPKLKEEAQPETISDFIDKDVKEFTTSRSRTISWIVLITCVITIPLFAWWYSQPSSSWYQSVLNFFGF